MNQATIHTAAAGPKAGLQAGSQAGMLLKRLEARPDVHRGVGVPGILRGILMRKLCGDLIPVTSQIALVNYA